MEGSGEKAKVVVTERHALIPSFKTEFQLVLVLETSSG